MGLAPDGSREPFHQRQRVQRLVPSICTSPRRQKVSAVNGGLSASGKKFQALTYDRRTLSTLSFTLTIMAVAQFDGVTDSSSSSPSSANNGG